MFTVTSLTAGGKSSLIEGLKTEFAHRNIEMNFISVGAIMRNYARVWGFPSIEDFSGYNRAHPEDGYDKKCDNKVREIGEKNHRVIEGRLPHIFVPKGFHILLHCPLDIRARRRHERQNYDNLSFDETKRLIEQRDSDDNSRYEVLYPGCIWADSDFDSIVNSSTMTVDEEVQAIFRDWERWILKK